ncbi:MAG TPA: L,D-transpeptidase family protein [Pseudolabrys sp.]|jgi:murein L,D-transpeptidase YcbB/YkuD
MRNKQFGHLLCGTVLALAVITPIYAATTPDPTESASQSPSVTPEQIAPAAQPPSVTPAATAPDTGGSGSEVEAPPPAIASPVADKLRAVITSGQFDKRIDRAPEREAMAAFYAARNYAPLWIADGQFDARAKSVIARLQDAAADGLDPADYPVPSFGAAAGAEELADADITLSYSALTYARHLATGRIAPSRAVAEVDYGDHMPAPADILSKIANTADSGAALESFNPPHHGFQALKAKLAELRGKSARGRRFSAVGTGKPSQEVNRVLANMERWRWLPRDLGRTYVMVNVPDFTLRVMHDDQEQWRTKIVAGKPQTPTPLLTAPMDTILVNPSWHVPQSIIKHELMPRYGRDPNIFARMGLSVKRSPDGTLSVTQPPGAGNALGRIKFNFTNKFSVYLHDTPQKHLFASETRAFSHGCMRVENPTMFGEVMLHLAMNGPTPNAQQLSALFGREEHAFKLTDRPMVHLTYQTAFLDDFGKLQLREDIYGLDDRIRTILNSDERLVADIAPAEDTKFRQQAVQANQDTLRRVERGEAPNASEFFDQLPSETPRGEQRRPTGRIRPQPVAAAPGFHPETPQSSPPRPFLAIFGR